MRRKRIVIYGGTDLPEPAVRLVHHLVQALLAYPDTVIVTGGIIAVREHRQWVPRDQAHRPAEKVPTDLAARRAAEALLGKDAGDRLESWLPDRDEDDRKDLERDWGRATRVFDGSTAEGRRFALVLETDAIITFKGEIHTATVLELALRAKKPALPMPFTGGDSERYWKKHRKHFQSRFKNADALFDALDAASLDSLDELAMQELSKQIAGAVARALDRWCLVLMPFGDWGAEAFFEYVVRPVIEKESGYIVDRLDQSSHAGHIPQAFLEHMARADAVIADITDTNPNVMYEIGHVHGRRTAPFLFWRRAREQSPPDLPFYFRPETFRLVDPADKQDCRGFGAALGQYLREVVESGMPPWPSDPNATELR
jgi:nucleoside 2-deoxyribosyltransferase